MERGYFHPARGYWQTTDAPSPEILAAYPEGTVEVPLCPGAEHVWTGESWDPVAAESPSIDTYRIAVQAHIDAMAQSRGYDSGVSLASYVASSIPAWAAEAVAFVNWRDAVWSQVYAIWEVAQMSPPTPAELVAGLPKIKWPEI